MKIIGQICAFGAPFGGLEATYNVHLRLIGKLVGDFLLVIIELFSLGAFVLSQYTRLTDGRTDRQTDRKSITIACVTASQSHAKKTSAQIIIPYERSMSLVLRQEEWLVGDVLFYMKFWAKMTHPLKNAEFQAIFARSASAVTPSERSSIITNRKSTMGFPMSY